VVAALASRQSGPTCGALILPPLSRLVAALRGLALLYFALLRLEGYVIQYIVSSDVVPAASASGSSFRCFVVIVFAVIATLA